MCSGFILTTNIIPLYDQSGKKKLFKVFSDIEN